MKRTQLGLTVAGVIAMMPGIAFAQVRPTEDQQQSQAAERPDGGDMILVTARRRAENQQTVPLSVTALGGEALDKSNFRDLSEVTRLSPGVNFAGEGSRDSSNISIRGLAKIPNATGTPAVVVYFNEVPLAGQALSIPSYDVQSIQVLKGPQGTLFGRNTIGGALLVTSRSPTYQTEGYIRGGIGNLAYRSLEGALNVPLVDDRVALRLSGLIRRREGFTKDLASGLNLDNTHQDSFRASLLLEPSSRIKNTTVFDYYRSKDNGSGFILFRINNIPSLSFIQDQLDEALAQQQARGIRKTFSALTDPYAKTVNWGISNTTTFELADNLTLKNIFGYRYGERLSRGNNDGLPPISDGNILLYNAEASGGHDEQFSNELQLQGSAFDGKLDFLIGGFYLRSQPDGDGYTSPHQFDFFGSNPLQVQADYQFLTSKAIFGQLDYDLSGFVDGLTATAGARYTWTDVKQCGDTNLTPSSPTDATSPSECLALGVALRDKQRKPTWTLGLEYRASQDVFLYVTSRRGVREGGINSPLFNSPNTTGDPDGPGPIKGADLRPYQTYRPEIVTDLEIGAKTEWQTGGVRGHFNIAGFRMWYKDAVQFINVAGFVDQDSGFPARGIFGFNGGKLTITGVDVEGNIAPTRNLDISFAGQYLDQKVDSVIAANPFPTPAITLPSPKYSFSAALDYTLPVPWRDGDISFHFDYFWKSKSGVQGTTIPGYDLGNLRVDWRDIENAGVDVGFFVKNVFDEEYIQSPVIILQQFPPNSANFGEPRTYGVEVTYRF